MSQSPETKALPEATTTHAAFGRLSMRALHGEENAYFLRVYTVFSLSPSSVGTRS
jgi:hypothetical protein